MPDLSRVWGLTLEVCDAMSWLQLNHYRAQLPTVPPPGAVYLVEPPKP
jgi:hypothetical protein